MQTDLRGRDLITTQEWSKEEIETLLDVAWDLKRKRALGETARAAAGQGAGDDVLLQQHPHAHQL